jgi:hypothetical protein
MHWYPITGKEAALLLLVFVMSGIFSHLQPLFIAPAMRPLTYVFFLFLLMLAYFPIARPAVPMDMAKFLAVLLGAMYTVMIILLEVIIRHNYSWGSVIVIAGAFLSPLVAGGIYSLLPGPRPVR